MTVQQEVVGLINGMTEDNIKAVLDYIKSMAIPVQKNDTVDVSKRIGLAKGLIHIDDDAFDAADGKIAALFEESVS